VITEQTKIVSLQEYRTTHFSKDDIPEELGELLYHKFGDKINVTPPSFKTDYQWEITPQGWVGYIPLSEEMGLALKPKVPISNLFGMWEYAYRLRSFNFLEGLYSAQSLQEFYEQLASILAKRVLDRGRKGYYRTYLPRAEHLPYLRGNMDIRRHAQSPWQTKLYCHYQEHTPDIDENQILAWTLFVIARSGQIGERVAPVVRRAYRNLQGLVSLQPYRPEDCIGRLYNRLNQDYQPLHALSRFFLEQSGPQLELGDRTMIPFLVNLANLYELFVAEWLKAHLPPDYVIKPQERVDLTKSGDLFFKIDLVLYHIGFTNPVCVLDTKYKLSEGPSSDDIAQVVSYAQTKDCNEAVLIYPSPLKHPLDGWAGDIRIRSLTFSLDGDLEEAGQEFLHQLLPGI
jgi:5-methylcytosine-specific restriction enzyme subunit McrC